MIGKGNGPRVGWTNDMEHRLRTMVYEGQSAKDIAKALGVTKGAVVGKVNRLGLDLRGHKVRAGHFRRDELRRQVCEQRAATPRPAKVKAPKPAKAAAPAPEPLPPEPPPPRDLIPLDQLKGEVCRFSYGDPRDEGFGFCGAPGHPWCAEHRAVVFTAVKPRPVSAGPERNQTRWPSLGWGRGKGID